MFIEDRNVKRTRPRPGAGRGWTRGWEPPRYANSRSSSCGGSIGRQKLHRSCQGALESSHVLAVLFSPGNDRRHGQEVDPDSVPPIAVLLGNLVLVANPVLVPAVDSCRVVDTKNINIFDLKSSRLDLANDPTKRTRGVRAGEDILVHENTPVQVLTFLMAGKIPVWNLVPDEILILPVRTNTSDLEDEDAIVVEKVVDLPEEGLVPADSNVLGTAMVNSPGEKRRV